jgi:hypothetical protein
MYADCHIMIWRFVDIQLLHQDNVLQQSFWVGGNSTFF